MNPLEHYLTNNYTIRPLTVNEVHKYDLNPSAVWVEFNGIVNCYGNKTWHHDILTLDRWKIIKERDYFYL